MGNLVHAQPGNEGGGNRLMWERGRTVVCVVQPSAEVGRGGGFWVGAALGMGWAVVDNIAFIGRVADGLGVGVGVGMKWAVVDDEG